jgi:selenophosphate synthase
LSDEFWHHIFQYRELGLDPLRWITTSSNEVNSLVLYDSLKQHRKLNHLIEYSWYDAFPYSGKNPDIIRRQCDFKDPAGQSELRKKRIVSLLNIHVDDACNAKVLLEGLSEFYAKINPKYPVRCLKINTTSDPKSEFALLDYIDLHRGEKIGYTVFNTGCIKVIDPSQNPDAEINVHMSLTPALENLALLGCTFGFRIIPVYDAPSEEMINSIQSSHDAFGSKYNIPVDDYGSLKTGKLFLGGTVYAHTEKELPVRYDLISSEMVILLTDKFGSLCPLNTLTIRNLDPTFHGTSNPDERIDYSTGNDILKSLGHPRFSLSKIVAKYSPQFGNQFDTDANIIAVHPVGSDGVLALLHLSRLSNSHLIVNDIPMEYEEHSKQATKECIISNSTCAGNDCHLIVASNEVANNVLEDLRKHSYDPMIIGRVANNDGPKVTISNKLMEFVAAKYIISRFELYSI